MRPRATYRLQFTPQFGFADAAALVPYLARLGISHLYASPVFRARPGSTHGYDIVDHNALNPELGTQADFDALVAALKAHGLGLVLDIVPNHMGVGGADNPFWLDVLEWGRASAHAGWFDIDWDTDRPYLKDKLLVPFLGGQYGAELAAGHLTLAFDAAAGTFAVWAYGAHKLPVCPLDYGRILGDRHPLLERFGDDFAGLLAWRPEVVARAHALEAALAEAARTDPDVAAAITAAVARFHGRPGDLESWERLDRLVRRQHWRPAHFRVASDDINYRRFFNINDLAGIRMELPAVFDHAHRLVFSLMGEGAVDGLRIDHIDGLLDPKAYLERLRRAAPPRADGAPFTLLVEKILAEHESLPDDWPIDGTTGYEVANLLLGLMIDPEAEIAFTRVYADMIGRAETAGAVLRESKKRIMAHEMSSELDRLAAFAARIARQNPRTEDFTETVLRRGLREIVAAFAVYRTYLDDSGVLAEADRRELDAALVTARTADAAIDASVYDFLGALLSGDLVARPRSGFSRHDALSCAMKLQQYSGPVMAKGLEDTAFYRYNRFLALNEVGGHPDHFGVPPERFHAANALRAARWPGAMLGTSTHDTKRGEDVRARLAALAERADDWAEAVRSWSRILRAPEERADPRAAPDRNDEYAIYQMLVGTWPVELLHVSQADAERLAAYAERLNGAMTKMLREAKVHSTWDAPDAAYETATLAFVDAALTGPSAEAFRAAFLPFARQIAEAGVDNSLIQLVLKLTIPGLPDIYQGTEFWDLSMVDPDNRRPVDFARRSEALEALTADGPERTAALRQMRADWADGRIKLAVTRALLAFRQGAPALFSAGDYVPLASEGPQAETLVAFRRATPEAEMVVVAARFPVRRRLQPPGVDSRVRLPNAESGWTDVLTGRTFAPGTAFVTAEDLAGPVPALVLRRA